MSLWLELVLVCVHSQNLVSAHIVEI